MQWVVLPLGLVSLAACLANNSLTVGGLGCLGFSHRNLYPGLLGPSRKRSGHYCLSRSAPGNGFSESCQETSQLQDLGHHWTGHGLAWLGHCGQRVCAEQMGLQLFVHAWPLFHGYRGSLLWHFWHEWCFSIWHSPKGGWGSPLGLFLLSGWLSWISLLFPSASFSFFLSLAVSLGVAQRLRTRVHLPSPSGT